MKIVVFLFKFYSRMFPRTPINNKPELVQKMAWRRIWTKPKMTQYIGAYMRHSDPIMLK